MTNAQKILSKSDIEERMAIEIINSVIRTIIIHEDIDMDVPCPRAIDKLKDYYADYLLSEDE